MLLRCLALVMAALIAAAPLRAQAPAPPAAKPDVDLLLVLAADISRSLDERKFRLQREGYAAALVNPRVIKAIESGPHGRIALTFMEWSGPSAQAVIVDWATIANIADARTIAERIRTAPRLFAERTAIGAAVDYSVRLFDSAPFNAPRRVIDVSGDGTSNAGLSVVDARDRALELGFTINGLVILSDVPLPTNPGHTHPPGGLQLYYENNVIGGPGAFALAAENFEAFGASISSKLVKEIAALPELPPVLPGVQPRALRR